MKILKIILHIIANLLLIALLLLWLIFQGTGTVPISGLIVLFALLGVIITLNTSVASPKRLKIRRALIIAFAITPLLYFAAPKPFAQTDTVGAIIDEGFCVGVELSTMGSPQCVGHFFGHKNVK
jgi:hypothetical protein